MRLTTACPGQRSRMHVVILATSLMIAVILSTAAQGEYTLTYSSVPAGGGRSTGSVYSLLSAVGTYANINDSSPAQAPTPNPMQWATAPYATGRSTVTMMAAEAQDPSGGVQYYFQNVTVANGSHDSGWQDSRTYTDVGLDPNTVYEYRVKARGFMRVETGYSVQLPARTQATLGETPEGSAEPVSGELGNDLSLQVDPFTGSVGYTLPIALPPARQGSEPSLALRYGGGGNGWCGVGWSLGMGAIQRDTRKGVPVARDGATFLNGYDDAKGFVVAFGAVNSRLVEVNAATHEYRAETDQAFLKYEYDATYDPNGLWTVTDKSGNKFYFGRMPGEFAGRSAGAAMKHPLFTSATKGDNAFLWALAKIQDINGNLTYIYYTQNAGQLYLDEIRYNGHTQSLPTTNSVKFLIDPNERSDKSVSYATGYRVETNKRLSKIDVLTYDYNEPNWTRVRMYHLEYDRSPSTLRSLLTSVRVSGTGDPNDPNSYLPPVAFDYQVKPFEFERDAQGDPILRDWGPLNSQYAYFINHTNYHDEGMYNHSDVMLLDINNDGLPDRVMRNTTTNLYNPSATPAGNVLKVQLNTGSGFSSELLDWGPVDALGATTSNDWNSTGSGSKYYWDKAGLDFGYALPSLSMLGDLNGDGFVDRITHRRTDYTASYDPSQSLNYYNIQYGTGNGFARTTTSTGGGTDFVTAQWGPLDLQGFTANDSVLLVYAYNQGYYWGSPSCTWDDDDGDYNITRLFSLDINGDGLPDRVMQGINAATYEDYGFYPASAQNFFRVQLNTGSGYERTAGSGGGTQYTTLAWGPVDAQGITGNSVSSNAWNALTSSTGGITFVSMADLNGDGLPDRVMCKAGTPYNVFEVQFNTGYGFERTTTQGGGGTDFTTRTWGPLNSQGQTNLGWNSIGATTSDDHYSGQYVVLADINGDGLPDRVMRSSGAPYSRFKIELNTGTGFTHQIDDQDIDWLGVSCQGVDNWWWGSPGASYSASTGGGDPDYSYETAVLCDIDGDGLVDRVLQERTAASGGDPALMDVFKVQLNKGPIPDLLCKVNGVLGGSVEVTYKPSTQYDNKDHNGISRLGFPVQTASSLTVDDGLGHRSTTTYEYSRGLFDGQAREFRGFGKVKVTDPAGAMSITYFHQGGGYEDPNGGEFEDANSVAKKGMPYRVEVYGSDSKLYTVTTNKVEESQIDPNANWYYAYVSQTTKLEYAGVAYQPDSNEYPTTYRAKVRQSVYDVANKTGNILKSIDLGEVGLGATSAAIATNVRDHTYANLTTDDDLYIHTGYATIANHPEIVNKIAYTKTTSDSAGSSKLKEIVFTYDTLGRVQSEQTWLDKNRDGTVNQYTTASTYGYDTYGNRSYSIDKAGIRTDTTYDSDYHMYPVTKTTGTFVTSTDYDVRSGLPVRTVDPAGMMTENVFDQFFRLTDVMASTSPNTDPNLWLTHIEYNLGGIVDQVSYNFVYQKHTGYEAYTYNDGLGRIVQTRTRAEPNEPGDEDPEDPNTWRYRVVASCYDERGNIEFQTLPFFAYGPYFTPPYSYKVNLSTSAPLDDDDLLANTVSTHIDTSALSYSTTYYWQVKKIGATGGVLATSSTWSFTTESEAQSEWQDPENPASTLSGLDYARYMGQWTQIPDFDTLIPTQRGTVSTFDIGFLGNMSNFAMHYTGYINITTGGAYTFYTQSNDGSRLYIGDTLVVNNDGYKTLEVPEQFGTINLKSGKHRITVEYFDRMYVIAYKTLTVSYKGPDGSGITKQVIPAGVLYRDNPAASITPDPYNAEPSVSITPRLAWEGLLEEADWDDAQAGIQTEYDAMGRVWRVTPAGDDANSPTGPSTTAYCDANDPWAQISTDAEGKVTKRYFDAAGRVSQIVEIVSTGNITTSYTYDRLGRLITTTDNLSNQFQAEYDSLDRKIRSIDPDMGTWTYAYDAAGRMTEQRDARGNKVQFVYTPDELGRVKQKIVKDSSNATKETVTYTYDTSDDPAYTVHKGQLYKVTDGQGWTKTGYDSQGRAIKASRYITETDHTYTTQTAYDTADRVTQITYPDTRAVIGYSYDGVGHLVKVESLWGTGADEVFYQASGFNAMHQEANVAYGNGRTTQYEYYEHTRRLKRMTTGGASTIQDIRYTYDMASNILSVTDAAHPGVQVPSCGLSNIVYDDLYRLTSVFSASENRTITYEYTALGNINKNGEMGAGAYTYHATKIHAVTAANGSTYAYDDCGNMTTRNRSGLPGQTLTYDEQNRLKQVAINGGNTVTFGYSAGGSRLWKKVNGQVTGLWIGSLYEEKEDPRHPGEMMILCHVYAGDRLVASFEPESGFACFIQHHPYLAAIWNFGDGVSTALFGGGRAPFSVMALAILVGGYYGLRTEDRNRQRRRRNALRKAGSLFSPSYVLTFLPSRPFRRQVILVSLTASVFLSSNPQAAYAGPGTPDYDPVFYYYHPDHLGSSQLMTDRDGDVVQQYGYSPFGQENYKNNALAFPISNRYTGQTLDEDTGLYYYGARYYDPELARFIQADSTIPDPEFSQAYNRYAYVYNNPLKFTDPTGQFPWVAAIFIGYQAYNEVQAITVAIRTGDWMGYLKGQIISAAAALIGGPVGGAIGGSIGGQIGATIGSAMATAAISTAMSGGNVVEAIAQAALFAYLQYSFTHSPSPSGAPNSSETAQEQYFEEIMKNSGDAQAGLVCDTDKFDRILLRGTELPGDTLSDWGYIAYAKTVVKPGLPSIGIAATQSHAWVVYIDENGEVSTYGITHRTHEASFRATGTKLKGNLWRNGELHSRPDASYWYNNLSDAQVERLQVLMDKSYTYSFPTYNCSSFASDTFKAVTGINIDADDWWGSWGGIPVTGGFETPQEIIGTIRDLKPTTPPPGFEKWWRR